MASRSGTTPRHIYAVTAYAYPLDPAAATTKSALRQISPFLHRSNSAAARSDTVTRLSAIHNHARHRFPYQPPHMSDLAGSAHILCQNRHSCYHLRRHFPNLPAQPRICPSQHDFNHLKNYVACCSNPSSLSMKYYTSTTYVLPFFYIGIHLLKQRLQNLQTLHKLRWEMSITRHIHEEVIYEQL